MDEVSESFHLRAKRRDDAVALLVAARVDGFVFEAKRSLVTFVCEEDARARQRLLAESRGVLVRWAYEDDDGDAAGRVSVDVYVANARVARIERAFAKRKGVMENRDEFVRLKLLSAKEAIAIERGLALPMADERSFGGYDLAYTLGLPRFENLSYEGQLSEYVEPDDRKARIEVDWRKVRRSARSGA
jgi:hypothetical protein